MTMGRQKRFATEAFDLLCRASGCLTIHMSDLDHLGEGVGEGYHILNIWHVAEDGFDFWEIDGQTCIANPPKINFDDMPTEVETVQLYFVSQGLHEQECRINDPCPVEYLCPDCQVIGDFAYKGNVDIDAWVDRQREFAIYILEHPEEFANIGLENFDDIDDMDDIDMQG